MQPIETHYKGYRFRSRLEARWAVFFDHLRLSWEYEPEGFDLGDGVWYLPDFKVTERNGATTWYEIKPEGVCRDAKFEKFKAIIERGNEALLGRFFGDKALLDGDADAAMSCDWAVLLHGDPVFQTNRGVDKPVVERLYRNGIQHQLMQQAALAARKARFEHGEGAYGRHG